MQASYRPEGAGKHGYKSFDSRRQMSAEPLSSATSFHCDAPREYQQR